MSGRINREVKSYGQFGQIKHKRQKQRKKEKHKARGQAVENNTASKARTKYKVVEVAIENTVHLKG